MVEYRILGNWWYVRWHCKFFGIISMGNELECKINVFTNTTFECCAHFLLNGSPWRKIIKSHSFLFERKHIQNTKSWNSQKLTLTQIPFINNATKYIPLNPNTILRWYPWQYSRFWDNLQSLLKVSKYLDYTYIYISGRIG